MTTRLMAPRPYRLDVHPLGAGDQGLAEDARVGLAELSDADAARLHRLLRKVRLGAGDFDSGDAHGR